MDIFLDFEIGPPAPPLGDLKPPKTPSVLGSPDFSPLFHRPIGIKLGIRVLLMIAHGYFFRFCNRTPCSPPWGPKTPQVLGSPDFSSLSHRPIGIKFGVGVLLVNARGHFSRF